MDTPFYNLNVLGNLLSPEFIDFFLLCIFSFPPAFCIFLLGNFKNILDISASLCGALIDCPSAFNQRALCLRNHSTYTLNKGGYAHVNLLAVSSGILAFPA